MARIVLVADDSPTIQKRALGILKGEGFEVETVSNGVAAIKRLAVLHPVVILADVSMPGRDGYEVCDFVKKSPELSHVPVLLVASDMEPYDNARGAEVRADGIIKKPFEAAELIAIVLKFADQFEAATITTAPPPITPPKPRERTHEFIAALGDEADDAPTVVQHVEPDFSAHTEGLAFAEPGGEEPHAFTLEPHPEDSTLNSHTPHPDTAIFAESALEPPSHFTDEHHQADGASSAPSPYAPTPPPSYSSRTPSFLEGLEASAPEPVFIEEHPEQAAETPEPSFEARTMIFRAPLAIADPVWNDETTATATEHDHAGEVALEPQFELEESAPSAETPHEHPHEHPHTPPAVSATSLDSFSLDDAAAGQVRFASELPEVVYAVPTEEAVPPASSPEVVYTDAAPAEPAAEVVYTETAVPETAPEAFYTQAPAPEHEIEAIHTEDTTFEPAPEAALTETAPVEAEPEAVHADAVTPELEAEAVHTETAPPEPEVEVIHEESAAPEPAREAVHVKAAQAEPELETVHTETTPAEPAHEAVETEPAVHEPAVEPVHAETSHAESALEAIGAAAAVAEVVHAEIAEHKHEPEAVHTEAAATEPEEVHQEISPPGATAQAVHASTGSLEAALEAFRAEIARTAAKPEAVQPETAPVEPVAEAAPIHEPTPEPTQHLAAPEPVAEVAAPQPTLDKELVYSIIHKVVVRMAPPVLHADAVEEIAKRLADEITAEISPASSHPLA